ncbi:MAG TPA: GntR family transcriptional regulator [Propionibacteriaceae bacterium]
MRTAIVNGEMPAGYRLRIRDIAALVGTSVMPVREAIQRLEEAGLAERIPHKGAVVKGLTLHELLHVYGVRRLLEVEAARLGAATIEESDIGLMQVEYDKMRAAIEAGEAIAVLDHDEAFLSVLYQASGNTILTGTIRTLWEQCRFYKIVGARATLQADDDSPLWRFQAQLLAAARSGDANLAAEITNESLLNATARIHGQLTSKTPGEELSAS